MIITVIFLLESIDERCLIMFSWQARMWIRKCFEESDFWDEFWRVQVRIWEKAGEKGVDPGQRNSISKNSEEWEYTGGTEGRWLRLHEVWMTMYKGGWEAGEVDRGQILLGFVCHGQEFGLYPKSTMQSLKKFKHGIIFI